MLTGCFYYEVSLVGLRAEPRAQPTHSVQARETQQAIRSSTATPSPPPDQDMPNVLCTPAPSQTHRRSDRTPPHPNCGQSRKSWHGLYQSSFLLAGKPQASKPVFVKRFGRGERQLWWGWLPGLPGEDGGWMEVITGSPDGPSGRLMCRGRLLANSCGAGRGHLFFGSSGNRGLFT